jgi:hypothetical protein
MNRNRIRHFDPRAGGSSVYPAAFIVCLLLAVGWGMWPEVLAAETDEDAQPFSYRQQLINKELSQQEMLGEKSGPENTEGSFDGRSPTYNLSGDGRGSAPLGFTGGEHKARPFPPERTKAVTEALNRVEVGLETFAFSYREPGIMKDRGCLTGVYGVFTHRLADNQHIKTFKDAWRDKLKVNKLSVEGRFAGGDVDYESEETGTRDGLNFYVFELRGLLAYEMPLIPSGAITPFFGVGFRYLKDDSGGKVSSTNNWFYDRESRYFYLPIGLEISRRMKNRWSVSLTCEYDIFLVGKQKSHLENGGATVLSSSDGQLYVLDTLENDQEEGFGLRGSLKFMKSHDRWDFVFEPFVRYWNLKDSQLAQWTSNSGSLLWYYDPAREYPVYGYEPENNTTEYGVRIGFYY